MTLPAIISNNCWGAAFYQQREIPYNTPTVGLWIHADDYLALLEGFSRLIRSPLTFAPSRHGAFTYPTGLLGGEVEIQFMHYESREEALSKWTARSQRLPGDTGDLRIKICDRDGLEQSHLDRFAALPFRNKVAFLTQGRFNVADYPWAIEVDGDGPFVADGATLWNATKATERFNAADWMASPTPPAPPLSPPASGPDRHSAGPSGGR